MKRIILVCLTLLLTGAAGIFAWRPAHSAPPRLEDVVERLNLSGQNQDHGWQVCLIGELINVPGVGLRQRFELCHSNGTIVNTYCLDPNQPIPQLGALCSRVSPGSDEFWCGDGVQRVLQFAVLQTPAPSVTPTMTSTTTSTPTPTFTTTPARTLTALPQIEESPTPIPSATVYYRPRAGGPGNLEFGFGLALFGLLAAGGWWVFKARARSGA